MEEEQKPVLTEPASEEWADIDLHLYAEHLIPAIKRRREKANSSLKEATDACHERWQMLRAKYPERFSGRVQDG